MADREPDRLLGGDERTLLVDAHLPARREAEQPDDTEHDGRPHPAVVDERTVGHEEHQQAERRQCQVDRAGDAPAGVVGESVGAGKRGGVEVVREHVADVVVPHVVLSRSGGFHGGEEPTRPPARPA